MKSLKKRLISGVFSSISVGGRERNLDDARDEMTGNGHDDKATYQLLFITYDIPSKGGCPNRCPLQKITQNLSPYVWPLDVEPPKRKNSFGCTGHRSRPFEVDRKFVHLDNGVVPEAGAIFGAGREFFPCEVRSKLHACGIVPVPMG